MALMMQAALSQMRLRDLSLIRACTGCGPFGCSWARPHVWVRRILLRTCVFLPLSLIILMSILYNYDGFDPCHYLTLWGWLNIFEPARLPTAAGTQAVRVSAVAGRSLLQMRGPSMTQALICFESGVTAIFEAILAPGTLTHVETPKESGFNPWVYSQRSLKMVGICGNSHDSWLIISL